MADQGVCCTVISPVPITKYRTHIKTIPKEKVDKTPNGGDVHIYYPRYISLSSKRIGRLNTGIFSEKLFEKAALTIARELDDTYDAAYGHFFLSGGLAAVRIGKEKNIPSFIAYGECNYDTEIVRLYRELNRKDIEGLSGIISVSSNNAMTLKSKEIFTEIPMIVAPNSVDMTLFYRRDKAECRKEFGLPADKFIVGFIGGFIERKGDKRLLEAINGMDGVYAAFAGRGINPPSGEKVLFCNALEHEKIPILLNAIDVFCLPTQNEGSCNAIVEAAACGVPVISSNLPFNDDLLTDDNSIRINPDSTEEIKVAISNLYENEGLRNELGQKIFEDSREFDINYREKRIEIFIRKVLRSGND